MPVRAPLALLRKGPVWRLVFAAVLAPVPAFAHDFWVEPEPAKVEGPTEVVVRLKVGHLDEVKEYERIPDRIRSLVHFAPTSTQAADVPGRAGEKPAGRIRVRAPGVHMVAYRSAHAFIEMSAPAFDDYLEHEGLTKVLAERRRRDAGDAREAYARYCKALIRVGDGDRGLGRRLGWPIELVAEPGLYGDSETIGFLLEFRGEPLAGARVDLMRLDDLREARTATTDAEGRVRFARPRGGRWMAATTHMETAPASLEAPPGTKVDPGPVDYESFWATLSFGL